MDKYIKDGIIQVDDILGVPFKYHPVKTNKKRYPMNPTSVTIHDTANPNADEHAHTNYVDHVESYIDWHITVGDEIIYQELPLNVNAWHAGDGGSGKGNRTSIAIELDETGDRAKTEENAIKLLYFLYKYIPTLKSDFIKKHQDWTSKKYPNGKWCPRVILNRPDGWKKFIESFLAFKALMRSTRFNDVNKHWAKESLTKMIKMGNLEGLPDGTFGPDKLLSRAELAVILDSLKLLD